MTVPMHILTFDIEDWFHILDNPETKDIEQWNSMPSRLESGVLRLLDFCDTANVKATFFILGWVAETVPAVVAAIIKRGHEIACHSHRHQLVYSQSPEEFERDLVTALDKIQEAAGIRPTAYRAPGFSITQNCLWAFDILARNGIDIDASIFPASHAHGGLPSLLIDKPCLLETYSGEKLKVFPMNFRKVFGWRVVFSGGGYFRLLPYPAIKSFFKKSDYVMTYFHPRDFDAGQPMVPGMGAMRRFKSYVGIARALDKLERLGGDVQFMSLGSAAKMVDWSQTQTILLSKDFKALA